MEKRLKIIFNPIAGSGGVKNKIKKAKQYFEKYNYKVDLLETQKKGDASRFARDHNDDIDAIVALGGDGTINEVINGARMSNVPIGIIPGGTSNLLAYELGIPTAVDKACRIIRAGKTFSMDSGYDTTRYFNLMAGIGMDAEVVKVIDSNRKGNISFATYALPILKTVFNYEFPSLSVKVDGRHIADNAAYVFVSNVKSYIGPVRFAYLAKPNDGKFDICIIKGKGKLKIPKYIFGAITGTLRCFSDVIYLRGTDVEVYSDSKVIYQLDGDPGGCLPARFTLAHKAIKFLVP